MKKMRKKNPEDAVHRLEEEKERNEKARIKKCKSNSNEPKIIDMKIKEIRKQKTFHYRKQRLKQKLI